MHPVVLLAIAIWAGPSQLVEGGDLHVAARDNDIAEAKRLLALRIDANGRDSSRRTPLHLAAEHGRAEVAELLLSHGARVRATTNDGETPLHFAAAQGSLPVVELLLLASSHSFFELLIYWHAGEGLSINARRKETNWCAQLAYGSACPGVWPCGVLGVAVLLAAGSADS